MRNPSKIIKEFLNTKPRGMLTNAEHMLNGAEYWAWLVGTPAVLYYSGKKVVNFVAGQPIEPIPDLKTDNPVKDKEVWPTELTPYLKIYNSVKAEQVWSTKITRGLKSYNPIKVPKFEITDYRDNVVSSRNAPEKSKASWSKI